MRVYDWNTNAKLDGIVFYNDKLGIHCGYVKIPNDHSLYQVDLENDGGYRHGIMPHGGITYNEFDNDGYWVVGFDCAHVGDYIPKLDIGNKEHYWDAEDTALEVENLAWQIRNYDTA